MFSFYYIRNDILSSGYKLGRTPRRSVGVSVHLQSLTSWRCCRSSQFYLVLDVANLTSQEMELYYTESKHMLIEGHESCRVPVPVDRCPLAKLTKAYLEQENDLDDMPVLERICSDHIASLVQLHWQLLGTDTKGKATLKGITLTSAILDIVRMSPVSWGWFFFMTIKFFC